MGARHSTRRESSSDSNGGAGDATSAIGRSTHRSLTSSGKLRTRWSKVARSHSDRTPASLSVSPLNYSDTPDTKNLHDFSQDKNCSSVSTACQTQVPSVSVMTQTEPHELLRWKMIDDDRSSFASDSSSDQHDVGNGSKCDSSRKSHCELQCRQQNLRHPGVILAKSCSSDKENDSSVVCNGNHTMNHNCFTDATVNLHSCCTAKCLLSEAVADGACSAIDNFKPENKVVQESSCISNVQWQTTKNPNVYADVIKFPDKRKQSNSSGSRSVAKHLVERNSKQRASIQISQLDDIIHHENTVDLGSSFGSLNSEDMMLNTELDDMTRPSHVRSRHSSVDAGCLAHCRQSSGHFGRKYSEYMHSDSVDSPRHSDSAVVGDDIKHGVNGWIALDPVSKLSPTEINSRCVIY